MENNRAFLAEFLEQEIYLIKEGKTEYQNPQIESENEFMVRENEIEYSGSNSGGVIIIVDENISEEEMTLLDNVLSSINLTRDEVALIRSDDNFDSYMSQLSDIESTKILSLGITSVKSRLLDIQTKYAPTTIEGRTVIIADSLSLLNENIHLKRKLWNTLKKVF